MAHLHNVHFLMVKSDCMKRFHKIVQRDKCTTTLSEITYKNKNVSQVFLLSLKSKMN